MALTAKQKKFVSEYLIDLNATQAAIRAGYSAKNADKIGPELLQKTTVHEAIQLAMGKREKRTEITQDMVLILEYASLRSAHTKVRPVESLEMMELLRQNNYTGRPVSYAGAQRWHTQPPASMPFILLQSCCKNPLQTHSTRCDLMRIAVSKAQNTLISCDS